MGINKLSIVLISTVIGLTGCATTDTNDCERLRAIHSEMVTSWNAGPQTGVEKTLEDQRNLTIEMSSLPISSEEIQQTVDDLVSSKLKLIGVTNDYFKGNGSESDFISAQNEEEIASAKLARICKWELSK